MHSVSSESRSGYLILEAPAGLRVATLEVARRLHNFIPAVTLHTESAARHAGLRADWVNLLDDYESSKTRSGWSGFRCWHVTHHTSMIAEHANVDAVREAGIAIHVHGWRKRSGRWELHRNEDVS